MESVRKKANQPWPAGVSMIEVNQDGDSRSAFVTDGGKYPQYFFFATNKDLEKPDGRGDNFDIFFLTKLNAKADFTNPTPLHAISTPADELHPWLSRDGLTLYFSRKDKDGWHTYVASRQKGHEQLDKPDRLGFPPGFHHPTLTPDGKTMYLQGPLPGKRWGIYRSVLNGQSWSSPEPLLALNHPDAPKGDISPALSHDGSKLYFASDRPGGKGGLDLWVAPMGQVGKR
jgi:Tol biopolymer transport system component